MSQFFHKPFRCFGGNINVNVNLSNYNLMLIFPITNLKNITFVDTSSFALKTNLANSKTEVDR